MIAGGAGVTPFMGFIHELLVMNVRATVAATKAEAEGLCGPRCVRLVLLVFDRHISDIFLKDELDRLVKESGGFLTVIHSITGGPDELTDAHTSASQVSHYLLGRVSEEIILTAFAHLEGQKITQHQIAPMAHAATLPTELDPPASATTASAMPSRSGSVAGLDAIGFAPIPSAVAGAPAAPAALSPPSPSMASYGATPAVEMTLHDVGTAAAGSLAGSPPPSEAVWASNSVGNGAGAGVGDGGGGVVGASVSASGTSFPPFGSALGRPSVLVPMSPTRTSVNASPTPAVPAAASSSSSPSAAAPAVAATPRASWLRDPPRVFMCGPIDFMRSTCGVLDDLKFDMARVECL